MNNKNLNALHVSQPAEKNEKDKAETENETKNETENETKKDMERDKKGQEKKEGVRGEVTLTGS